MDVFRASGRTVPYYNDKHFSWKWEWAKEMYDTSRKMGFPLMAGSSLPVTWRMPAVDMPLGATVREAVCVVVRQSGQLRRPRPRGGAVLRRAAKGR